jgi:hypothetical protein
VFAEGGVESFAGLVEEFAGDRGDRKFEVICAGEIACDLGEQIGLCGAVFVGELAGF